MRALPCFVAVVALAACGPKVDPKTPGAADDLDVPAAQGTSDATPVEREPPRPEAPPGKGLRSGTIERARLLAILDGGPGAFLSQVEVTARRDGDRFIGWQLVQLIDRGGPLIDVDLAPGDVLLAINGQTISRPDQLQTVWDSLRTSNELVADLWRGGGKFRLAFAISPSVAAPATK